MEGLKKGGMVPHVEHSRKEKKRDLKEKQHSQIDGEVLR